MVCLPRAFNVAQPPVPLRGMSRLLRVSPGPPVPHSAGQSSGYLQSYFTASSCISYVKAILETSPCITWDLCQLVAKQPVMGSPKSLRQAPHYCSPGIKLLLILQLQIVSGQGTCCYSEESWRSGSTQKPRRCWKGEAVRESTEGCRAPRVLLRAEPTQLP